LIILHTMRNIYLVGFMGTGKTSCGKIIARSLQREFVEMDEVIEAREGMSIVDIFAAKGEPYFRRKEEALLKELAAKTNLVVSCGGGLVCNPDNLALLKDTGLVFGLTAAASTIYERIKSQKHRPLLNVENPLERIRQLLQKRNPCYQQAHYIIETDQISAEQVAQKIIAIINHG